MARKRLGELLLDRRLITQNQLEQALTFQRRTGHRLGAALVSLGFLSESKLCEALAQALGLRNVAMPPDPENIDREALGALKSRFCEANDLFPLSLTAGPGRKTLILAMADPLNVAALDEAEFITGLKIVPVIAPLSGVRAAIRLYYFSFNEMAQQRPISSPPPVPRDGGFMERSGGETSGRPAPSVPKGPLPPQDADLPLLTGELIEEPPRPARTDLDLNERMSLAELIKRRAEKNRQQQPKPRSDQEGVQEDLDYLLGTQAESPADALAKLETRFWKLLRIMAQKGLITREEFLSEIADLDD